MARKNKPALPLPAENLPFSQVLLNLAERDGGPMTVEEIVHAFGDRAFGAIMLVISLINILPLPPGGTTVTGAPMVLLSAQLAFGRETLWLPKWMMRASVPRVGFRNGIRKAAPFIRFVERLTKPRLPWLVGQLAQRLIGVVCLLLSLVLILPIFGGNGPPATAMALFSLGILQRDGLAVLVGALVTAVSIYLLSLVWKLAVASVSGLIAWVQGLIG